MREKGRVSQKDIGSGKWKGEGKGGHMMRDEEEVDIFSFFLLRGQEKR